MRIFLHRHATIGLACAGLLFLTSCALTEPSDEATASYAPYFAPGPPDLEPVRGEVKQLGVYVDGEPFACTTCHDGFEGTLTKEALEDTHKDITFDHGRNVRCLNCHNPKNSDAYVDFDGSEIPSDNPTMLCAKCHGPHFREWSLDVHGRVLKYWDKSFGEQIKLACVQCHDPHRPRFQPMKPYSPPVMTRFNLVRADGESHE